MNNGRRDRPPPAYGPIAGLPGIEDIWQGHLSLANDAAHNTAQDRIANLEQSAECKGQWLKVTVEPDGKYTVTNSRNNVSRRPTRRGSVRAA